MSTSQLGADIWVLASYPTSPQADRYFVDVGACDGHRLSNTALLEKRGWHGLCIDPFPTHFEDRPRTIVHRAVVWDTPNQTVEFVHNAKHPGLSGVRGTLGTHKKKVEHGGTTHRFQTETLASILQQHNAPTTIHYMNLDIEGAELRVLQSFPFDRYRVEHISVEHNFEEPRRSHIFALLTAKGYERAKRVKWDDWYRLKK